MGRSVACTCCSTSRRVTLALLGSAEVGAGAEGAREAPSWWLCEEESVLLELLSLSVVMTRADEEELRSLSISLRSCSQHHSAKASSTSLAASTTVPYACSNCEALMRSGKDCKRCVSLELHRACAASTHC